MKQLNQNNFLRWSGGFNNAPYAIQANDDSATAYSSTEFIEIPVLSNDTSSIGIDINSVEIVQQDNEVYPAIYDPETQLITYYPPEGVLPGTRQIKYRFRDLNGNISNTATISIILTERPTAWRGYGPSYECQMSGGTYTGKGIYNIIERYYPDDSELVQPIQRKSNVSSDPDYVAPVDDINCNNSNFKAWTLAADYGGGGGVTQPACDSYQAGNTSLFYTDKNTPNLTNGVILYTSAALTITVNDGTFSDGARTYKTVGGSITNIGQCPSGPIS